MNLTIHQSLFALLLIVSSVTILSYVIQLAMAQTTAGAFLEYENPVYGIRIQHPTDWIADEELGHNVVTFAIQADEVPTLEISLEEIPRNITQDEYNKESNKILNATFGHVNVIESNSTTLAGNYSASRTVYTIEAPFIGVGLKAMKILTIKDNKVYAITYTAEASNYDNYLPIAQKMIDSFEIRK